MKNKISALILVLLVVISGLVFASNILAQEIDDVDEASNPQNTTSEDKRVTTTDISSPFFSLVVPCSGPPRAGMNADYVPCDFNAIMRQVQHLINIALVVGVLAAVALFTYAGFLYVTGQPKNIDTAKNIFQNVAIGFIIMLVAWFIVYEILIWLTGDPGFASLLSK